MRALRAALALSALLIASTSGSTADAQPVHLDGRGGYAAYGNSSPERLLFPDAADPDLTLGLRLSPRVDLQAGFQTRTDEATRIGQDEVAVRVGRARTVAAVLAAGYTAPLGAGVLQGRLSLGYDEYTASSATYRPDSTTVFTSDGPAPGYGLAPAGVQSGSGTFVHAGASASVAVPVGLGRVRLLPTAGLAATLSSRAAGTFDAQGARWMPFVGLPVTARVGTVALTYEVTAGLTKGTYRRGLSVPIGAPSRTSSNWTAVAEGSLRLNF